MVTRIRKVHARIWLCSLLLLGFPTSLRAQLHLGRMYVSCLLYDDPRYEVGEYRDFSSSVKAAILFSADLDLTKFSDTDDSILAYLGSACSAQRERCLEASPQFHLHGSLPPMYVGQGNADEDVPYSQMTNFVDSYRKAKGSITPFTAQGGPHSYAAEPQWFQANVDAVLSFLRRNL